MKTSWVISIYGSSAIYVASGSIISLAFIASLKPEDTEPAATNDPSFLEKNIEPRLKISPAGVAYCLSASPEYKFL